MHGYFIDLRLYTKARAIANPFAYAEHRERLIKEKLEKEQESRIRGAKQATGTKVPAGVKVNRSLAKKAAEAEERSQSQKRPTAVVEGEEGEEQRKRKKKNAIDTPSLLKDDRFGALFTNPDYQIDEDSREFALLNPSTKPQVIPFFNPPCLGYEHVDQPSPSSGKRSSTRNPGTTTPPTWGPRTRAIQTAATTEVRQLPFYTTSHPLPPY